MMTSRRRGRVIWRRPRRTQRRGAAMVEMALVTPLLLTMLFGVIEFGWAFMVHETLTNAAREACRVAILQGSTQTDVETRFAQAIAPTGLTVTPGMLTVDYVDLDTPADGVADIVNVSVTVPYSEVSITGLTSFLNISRSSIGSSCSMRREGV